MQFIGDRTLNMWLGNAEGSILHFVTYTYDNMEVEMQTFGRISNMRLI